MSSGSSSARSFSLLTAAVIEDADSCGSRKSCFTADDLELDRALLCKKMAIKRKHRLYFTKNVLESHLKFDYSVYITTY